MNVEIGQTARVEVIIPPSGQIGPFSGMPQQDAAPILNRGMKVIPEMRLQPAAKPEPYELGRIKEYVPIEEVACSRPVWRRLVNIAFWGGMVCASLSVAACSGPSV